MTLIQLLNKLLVKNRILLAALNTVCKLQDLFSHDIPGKTFFLGLNIFAKLK